MMSPVIMSWLLGLALVCGVYHPTDEQLLDIRPLEGMVICVDPGHGGQPACKTQWNPCYTGGAYGVVTNQTESDLNLRVSTCLTQYLVQLGAKVVMTRNHPGRVTNSPNKEVELGSRVKIANDANADLFVSVHHNWCNYKRDINYSAVYFSKQNYGYSQSLAHYVSHQLKDYMSWIPSVGAHEGDFLILNRASMPAVLVEYSFMSNPEEDYRLLDFEYNKREAWATARGIAEYALCRKFKYCTCGPIISCDKHQVKSKPVVKKTVKKSVKKTLKKTTSTKGKTRK